MTLSRQWIKKYRPKYYMILLTYWRRLGKNRSLIWKKISQCLFKFSINGFFFNTLIPNQKRTENCYGLELLQYDYFLMIQAIKSKKTTSHIFKIITISHTFECTGSIFLSDYLSRKFFLMRQTSTLYTPL